jgi:hypothetical protein
MMKKLFRVYEESVNGLGRTASIRMGSRPAERLVGTCCSSEGRAGELDHSPGLEQKGLTDLEDLEPVGDELLGSGTIGVG